MPDFKIDTKRLDKKASKKAKQNLPYSSKHIRLTEKILEKKKK